MNFWNRLFRLAETTPAPAPAITSTSVVHVQEVGTTGTKLYGGYSSEEYLMTLRGRQRADVYDQMRRSDPQLKMCYSAVANPIKSATWSIEPADDTPEAKADAEFAEHVLFKSMDRPFKKFVGECLSMVPHGFSLFEIVDKVVTDDPKFGTFVGIKKLAFRSQRTIERWNKNKETGDLETVSQYAYGDGMKVIDIPAKFLLLFNIEQEGDNYEGVSMFRPCYGCWFRKDSYLKQNAIGIERFATPTPVADVPAGKENTPEFALLISALQNYVSHQNSYLLKPAGWDLDLKTNTYDPSKVEASIDGEDKRMVKAFLANFLELGMSGTGAYALSNDLSDFFLGGLVHLADEICGPINARLIPRIIEINRGKRSAYPTLKASGIDDKAGKELAEVVQILTGAKVIVPDDNLEKNMRDRYRLPKASAEGQRQIAAPAPVPGVAPTLSERIQAAEARRRGML